MEQDAEARLVQQQEKINFEKQAEDDDAEE